MNNPLHVQVPADVLAAAGIKPKNSPAADRQHNREVGQMLKTASLHRPAPRLSTRRCRLTHEREP